MKNNNREILLSAIKKCCDDEQFSWLNESIASLVKQPENMLDELVSDIARARRRVGRQILGEHLTHLETSIGDLPVAHWKVGDAARVVLLLSALEINNVPDSLVNSVFKLGSDAEQAAIVSGLSLYADDDRYLNISLEAGRTNSLELFQAVTNNTPYPAQYYDQQAFNQLVLKSLFVGVNIFNIQNLNMRINEELSRMCEDYYDERVAADRSVPADIWLALAPYASSRGEDLLKTALVNSDSEHRYYAALAMSKILEKKSEYKELISQQLKQEKDERVRKILTINTGE